MSPYTYEYPRPAVTVDIAVIGAASGVQHVVLIRRGSEPFLGQWALPGGFVEKGERLVDAACRELQEETGLVVDASVLRQVGTYGDPGRDPRGWTVSVLFVHSLPANALLPHVAGGDDADEAHWFAAGELPLPLAFDHHVLVADALCVDELR